MDTNKYRTRQEIKTNESHPKAQDFVIGLDLGYSSTKIFYESGHICFPSYAKHLPNGVSMPDKKDILYRDLSTGEIYMVGYNAQNLVGSSETNDTDAELYSRKRYTDTRFRIICNTALALTCLKKLQMGDTRKIVLQTGLPSSYLAADTKSLKKALMNDAPFSLCIGGGPWMDFQFHIQEDDISVIPQPMGALYSCITKNDGTFARSANPKMAPDAKGILTGNTIILDAGFGTFDFYGIIERAPVCKDSVDDIGMRAVLDHACARILEDTDEDIRVATIQKYLASGKFTKVNEEELESESCDISPYIEEANQVVFERAKKKIQSITHSFRGYDYVIVDGGTGAAWYSDIKQWLSKMELSIFPSNFYDNLEMLYSNARGYYMFRYASFKMKKK